MDAVTQVPVPRNEPVLTYGSGTPEREAVLSALGDLSGARIDLPMTIGGMETMGRGKRFELTRPDARRQVLGVMRFASQADARDADRRGSPGVATRILWRSPVSERCVDSRPNVPLAACDPATPGSWLDSVAIFSHLS